MAAPAAEGAEGDMKLVVDGRTAEVAVGASVLDAVNRLGIPLPQLCKDPDRPPLGACRTCLVQVEGRRGAPAACHLPAREGMVVSTTAPGGARSAPVGSAPPPPSRAPAPAPR